MRAIRISLGAVFVCVLVSMGSAPAQPVDGTRVPVLVAWSGQLDNEVAAKTASFDFVTTRANWEDLWKTWRKDEPIPFVDFKHCAVLVAINRDPNQIAIGATVKADGDLAVTTRTTLRAFRNPTTKAYQLALIRREGVKSIKGKPISK